MTLQIDQKIFRRALLCEEKFLTQKEISFGRRILSWIDYKLKFFDLQKYVDFLAKSGRITLKSDKKFNLGIDAMCFTDLRFLKFLLKRKNCLRIFDISKKKHFGFLSGFTIRNPVFAQSRGMRRIQSQHFLQATYVEHESGA